jgi:hypothetical protein
LTRAEGPHGGDERARGLRHRRRRVHWELAHQEAPRPGLRRPRHPAEHRYVAASVNPLSSSLSPCGSTTMMPMMRSGREEDGAAPVAPRRAGAAAAVPGGHLRRRHLRAGHRRMRVRLPRRHAAGARHHQHQGTRSFVGVVIKDNSVFGRTWQQLASTPESHLGFSTDFDSPVSTSHTRKRNIP